MPWMRPATIAVIRANAPRVANNFESNAAQKLYSWARCAAAFLPPPGRWRAGRGSNPPRASRSLLQLPHRRDRAGPLLVPPVAGAAAGALPPGNGYGVLGRVRVRCSGRCWRATASATALVWVAAAAGTVSRSRFTSTASRVDWEQPIDIRTTIEYQTARWLDTHLPGAARVRAGHHRVLAERLQRRSAAHRRLRQRHPESVRAARHLPGLRGRQAAGLMDLLKAYGVDAVIGGGKDSREVYHPIAHPEKFAGLTRTVARRRRCHLRDPAPLALPGPHHARQRSGSDTRPSPTTPPRSSPIWRRWRIPRMPPAAFRWLRPAAPP